MDHLTLYLFSGLAVALAIGMALVGEYFANRRRR
jgi:hypothetical protein